MKKELKEQTNKIKAMMEQIDDVTHRAFSTPKNTEGMGDVEDHGMDDSHLINDFHMSIIGIVEEFMEKDLNEDDMITTLGQVIGKIKTDGIRYKPNPDAEREDFGSDM